MRFLLTMILLTICVSCQSVLRINCQTSNGKDFVESLLVLLEIKDSSVYDETWKDIKGEEMPKSEQWSSDSFCGRISIQEQILYLNFARNSLYNLEKKIVKLEHLEELEHPERVEKFRKMGKLDKLEKFERIEMSEKLEKLKSVKKFLKLHITSSSEYIYYFDLRFYNLNWDRKHKFYLATEDKVNKHNFLFLVPDKDNVSSYQYEKNDSIFDESFYDKPRIDIIKQKMPGSPANQLVLI